MTARLRLNLSDAVDDLAPPPPPCFLNRHAWKEYLKSAAAVQNNNGEQKVILITKVDATFNLRLNFCEDCSRPHRNSMVARGLCDPDHLTKLEDSKA